MMRWYKNNSKFLILVLVLISILILNMVKNKKENPWARKVTIKYNNMDIREILKDIANQTDMLLEISDEVIGTITVDINNKELYKVLRIIFKGTKYYFGILPKDYLKYHKNDIGIYVGIPKILIDKEKYERMKDSAKESYKKASLQEEFHDNNKQRLTKIYKEQRIIRAEANKKKVIAERKKRNEEFFTSYNKKVENFYKSMKNTQMWKADEVEKKLKISTNSKGKIELIEEKRINKNIINSKIENKGIKCNKLDKSVSFYYDNGEFIKKENYTNLKEVYFSDNEKYCGILLDNKVFVYKNNLGEEICKILNIVFGHVYKLDNNGHGVAVVHTAYDEPIGYIVYNSEGKIIIRDDKAYESIVNFTKDGKNVIISQNEYVELYNIHGNLIWKKWFPTDGMFFKTIISSNNLIYIQYQIKERIPDNNVIACLNLNGDIIWLSKFKHIIAGRFNLVNNNRNILFYCYKGGTFIGCLNSISGELIWFTKFNSKGYGALHNSFKTLKMNNKYNVILLANVWNKECGYYLLIFDNRGNLIAENQINLIYNHLKDSSIKIKDNKIELSTSRNVREYIIKYGK